MANPFLSSEEYDERAHGLYNDGQYDEALDVLREGLALYPNAVELHIGVGYARLAREEYAWARRSFEEAAVLEPEHEDALAGLGETLLKFGQTTQAQRCFRHILELGYSDDVDLMLQVGRALFREELMDDAREFFDHAVRQAPEMAEPIACVGYVQHRTGDDDGAVASLRRALQLDNDHAESRIYLANLLYDRGDYEAALYHLERTTPEDHWDELGVWRFIELKKSVGHAAEGDLDLKLWEERLAELGGVLDATDEMLAEIEAKAVEEQHDAERARGQLELFGALLTDLADQKSPKPVHRVETAEGHQIEGSWEEILRLMRDADRTAAGRSVQEYMTSAARQLMARTGERISTSDAESFIRGSADAGLLRIVK
ncbi:MAG: hypothetical protein NVS1B4_22180 [Gemmatimonadaceae bacterium]